MRKLFLALWLIIATVHPAAGLEPENPVELIDLAYEIAIVFHVPEDSIYELLLNAQPDAFGAFPEPGGKGTQPLKGFGAFPEPGGGSSVVSEEDRVTDDDDGCGDDGCGDGCGGDGCGGDGCGGDGCGGEDGGSGSKAQAGG